jgi:hypothetical protein
MGTEHSIKQTDFHHGDRVVITKLQLKLQSQNEPAYVVGAACNPRIHPTTLSFYARGIKPISAKHVVALCQLFECEPEDILGTIEVEVA